MENRRKENFNEQKRLSTSEIELKDKEIEMNKQINNYEVKMYDLEARFKEHRLDEENLKKMLKENSATQESLQYKYEEHNKMLSALTEKEK